MAGFRGITVTDCIQVSVTTDSKAQAKAIAQMLVRERLAACVQVIGPVTSIYRWQGKQEEAQEWLCLAKTTGARYDAVERAIREAHSYEVPEIVAVPIVAGSEPYLRWLRTESAEQ